MNIKAVCSLFRCESASACVSRSSNNLLLGRPVRASWSARRWARALALSSSAVRPAAGGSGARLPLLAPGGAPGPRARKRVARRLEGRARDVLGGDVVVDPDRPVQRVCRGDRLTDKLAPEGGAAAPPVLPLRRDRAPVLHLLVPGGIRLVLLVRAIDLLAVAADELARPPAEHLLEGRVAALVGAVLEERDSH